jgi:hypothetical protein
MDAFRFVAKLDHEVILERSRYQSARLVETVAVFARARSGGSEDEIAVRIVRLIGRDQVPWRGERAYCCEKHTDRHFLAWIHHRHTSC